MDVMKEWVMNLKMNLKGSSKIRVEVTMAVTMAVTRMRIGIGMTRMMKSMPLPKSR
jgi:hypothetical protein